MAGNMTRADFREIADAVAEAKRWVEYTFAEGDADHLGALSALESVTKELATASARRYRGGYGFNRSKFVEACGFSEA